MAFLAHREAIRTALVEGWPRAVVHGRMRDLLGIGYQQFVRYVDRYLPDALATHDPGRHPHPASAAVPAPLTAAVPRPPVAPAAPPALPTPGSTGFVYAPGRQSRDKLV